MTFTRGIPLTAHGAIEMFVAPAIMAAPFVLGFSVAATTISVGIGVMLLTIALQVEGPRRAVPIAAHAGFDYALAVVAISAGLTIAATTGAWAESVFLVGIGVAQVALTAATRFTAPRNAY
ncbi:MAG: hypothetical protein ACR2G3_07145 [Solirubrobacterales bacterium]